MRPAGRLISGLILVVLPNQQSQKRNRLACPRVRNIVKVHCNLRLVDSIEEIGHCDDNIDWSSDDNDSQ